MRRTGAGEAEPGRPGLIRHTAPLAQLLEERQHRLGRPLDAASHRLAGATVDGAELRLVGVGVEAHSLRVVVLVGVGTSQSWGVGCRPVPAAQSPLRCAACRPSTAARRRHRLAVLAIGSSSTSGSRSSRSRSTMARPPGAPVVTSALGYSRAGADALILSSRTCAGSIFRVAADAMLFGPPGNGETHPGDSPSAPYLPRQSVGDLDECVSVGRRVGQLAAFRITSGSANRRRQEAVAGKPRNTAGKSKIMTGKCPANPILRPNCRAAGGRWPHSFRLYEANFPCPQIGLESRVRRS